MQSARPSGERGTSRARRSPTDMAFRDEVEAVCARRDALRTQLERVTDAEERAELTSELGALVARIDDLRRKTALTVLADLRQATPCPASWEGMVGDGTVRHCALCEKNVYDFSGLTALEAAQLLHDHEGDVCARLHRRRDGRLILADCEVGRRRRRRRVVAGAAASLVLGGAAALASGGDEAAAGPHLAPDQSSFVLDEELFVSGASEPPPRLDWEANWCSPRGGHWLCMTRPVPLSGEALEALGVFAETGELDRLIDGSPGAPDPDPDPEP